MRKTRRNGVRKTTWRSLSFIATAWVHSEQFTRCHLLNGIYGASQDGLASFWEWNEPGRADPDDILPY